MLREMSGIEWGMWQAHRLLGSLDDEATDERFAVLTAAALNGPHFIKHDKKPYLPLDFLPKRRENDRRRDVQVSQQIRAFFLNRGK